MSEAYAQLVSQTRAWFERARADGWLSEQDVGRFDSLERRTPADLFSDAQIRPLVVALFGGTGVGKSSLLNRLAGQEIARTGLERPTSREVTVYLHESVRLADLPPELPVEHVHIKRHRANGHKDSLWIDAPDIDSTYEANRRLALAWLPYVDLLIYVVSPERYRDDVGWRVLQQRGERHGWMFALNRWDEGDASQKADFVRMLREAGFGEPLLFCTSCAKPARTLPTPDEFEQIEAVIRALLAEHGLRELDRLGHRARLLDMRRALQAALRRLGDGERWKSLEAARLRHWQHARLSLLQGMEWSIRAAASRFAIRQRGLIREVVRQTLAANRKTPNSDETHVKLAKASEEPSANQTLQLETAEIARSLWDEWAQGELAECLDALEVEVRRAEIAPDPIRSRLDGVAARANQIIRRAVGERLRLRLARPGTRLQRGLRRVTGFLSAALPLLALLWVGYNVVTGYFRASTGNGQYLGTNFAVNSILLVAVAWAVPFILDRLLRPSLERTAMSAMRSGLAEGVDQVGAELRSSLVDAARAAERYREAGGKIVGEISRLALQPIDAAKAPISRLLARPARSRQPDER